MINSVYIWTLSKHLFNILCSDWEGHRKHLGLYRNALGAPELWAGQSIRQETSLLERTTNRQTGRSDLGMWQTFSQKWTKLAYHFKEDNWQYLLPVIVFELWSQKFKFWRTFIHHSGPDASSHETGPHRQTWLPDAVSADGQVSI